MRATEFLDFLNRKKIDADTHDRYSHFEYRDLETGKILEPYKKIRRDYKKIAKKEEKNE